MINVSEEVLKGDKSFWEWNPEYKIIFKDLYKKDKTKDKRKSSGIMWAFYYKLHPQSAFFNMENKEEIISQKFLNSQNFNWEDYEEEEALFKETLLTQAERSLLEWNETMRKRDKWLKTQEYNLENAKDLDTILANTAKLYQLYTKVKKEFEDDKVKRGRGGKPMSASDAGRI